MLCTSPWFVMILIATAFERARRKTFDAVDRVQPLHGLHRLTEVLKSIFRFRGSVPEHFRTHVHRRPQTIVIGIIERTSAKISVRHIIERITESMPDMARPTLASQVPCFFMQSHFLEPNVAPSLVGQDNYRVLRAFRDVDNLIGWQPALGCVIVVFAV